MSRLDDELAAAVAESEQEAPPVTASPPSPDDDPARGGPSRGGIGLLIGLLVMGAAVVGIVMSGVNTAVWDVSVEELLARKQEVVGRSVRVEGILVKGSLQRRDQPCEYRFSLQQMDAQKRPLPGGKRIPVRYSRCTVPDTFRDRPEADVKVSATGKLEGEHFEATQIMAKCPSKYEGKDGS